MTLKYESEILFDLMKRDGDDAPSDVLPYESELKEKYLHQVEGAYPKLMDYRPEWLYYNLNAHLPADFPVESVSNVTNATFENVVPYAYGSAILKGSTKYRDIDTGEVLETFEDGRNLELVSVKMPVLTTTGKNLFDVYSFVQGATEKQYYSQNGDKLQINALDERLTSTYVTYKVKKDEILTLSTNPKVPIRIFDIKNNIMHGSSTDGILTYIAKADSEIGFKFIANEYPTLINVQLEKGSVATSYEPYKSNILTVNEDVELGSAGVIKDELNLLTGEITSYSYNYTITGDEPWADWAIDLGEYVTFYFYYENNNMTNIPNEKVGKGICNKFKVVGNVYNTQQRAIGIGLGYLSIGIKFSELNITSDSTRSERVNALKTWLKNNNVEIRLPYAQGVVKTVELTVTGQDGNTTSIIRPIEGTMHVSTSSQTLPPLLDMSVPVEATTQNLMSFVNIEEEE